MKELERRVAVAEEGEEKKKMDKDLTFKRANKEFAYAKLVRIYQCHPSNRHTKQLVYTYVLASTSRCGLWLPWQCRTCTTCNNHQSD